MERRIVIESFILYGLIGNLVGILLEFGFNMALLSTLKKEEFNYLIWFKSSRAKKYFENTTKSKRVFGYILAGVPTYQLWLSFIYLVTFLRHKGVEKYVMATITKDKFRIDQVVYYDVVVDEDK